MNIEITGIPEGKSIKRIQFDIEFEDGKIKRVEPVKIEDAPVKAEIPEEMQNIEF